MTRNNYSINMAGKKGQVRYHRIRLDEDEEDLARDLGPSRSHQQETFLRRFRTCIIVVTVLGTVASLATAAIYGVMIFNPDLDFFSSSRDDLLPNVNVTEAPETNSTSELDVTELPTNTTISSTNSTQIEETSSSTTLAKADREETEWTTESTFSPSIRDDRSAWPEFEETFSNPASYLHGGSTDRKDNFRRPDIADEGEYREVDRYRWVEDKDVNNMGSIDHMMNMGQMTNGRSGMNMDNMMNGRSGMIANVDEDTAIQGREADEAKDNEDNGEADEAEDNGKAETEPEEVSGGGEDTETKSESETEKDNETTAKTSDDGFSESSESESKDDISSDKVFWDQYERIDLIALGVIGGVAIFCVLLTLICMIKSCRARRRAKRQHFRRLVNDLNATEKFTIITPSDEESD